MRFCLLQARRLDDPIRESERGQFVRRLGVDSEQVVSWNLLSAETTFERVTEGFDAVLVGGSGEFSVNDDVDWMAPFVDTLGELADRAFPTFASCFGFQGLILALGGEVVYDPVNAEVGTFEVELLPDGRLDPIFASAPGRFQAQLGHKDRADGVPAGATLLARSALCPYQAIRAGTGLVYATQFHPELTGRDNANRLIRYKDSYVASLGKQHVRELLEGFGPSPETEGMLRRFAQLVAEDRQRG